MSPFNILSTLSSQKLTVVKQSCKKSLQRLGLLKADSPSQEIAEPVFAPSLIPTTLPAIPRLEDKLPSVLIAAMNDCLMAHVFEGKSHFSVIASHFRERVVQLSRAQNQTVTEEDVARATECTHLLAYYRVAGWYANIDVDPVDNFVEYRFCLTGSRDFLEAAHARVEALKGTHFDAVPSTPLDFLRRQAAQCPEELFTALEAMVPPGTKGLTVGAGTLLQTLSSFSRRLNLSRNWDPLAAQLFLQGWSLGVNHDKKDYWTARRTDGFQVESLSVRRG